jgi:hypothetical protein
VTVTVRVLPENAEVSFLSRSFWKALSPFETLGVGLCRIFTVLHALKYIAMLPFFIRQKSENGLNSGSLASSASFS